MGATDGHRPTFDLLARLGGTWTGRGEGNYPTIESFTYEEELRFEVADVYPLIHYVQRTWKDAAREPSHWESGFLLVPEAGQVQISNAQDGGRVEVLRGRVIEEGDALSIRTKSVVLGNDDRLVETARDFVLRDDRLAYEMVMTTTTTPEPKALVHLRADLRRG